jgi:hypothetical protein
VGGLVYGLAWAGPAPAPTRGFYGVLFRALFGLLFGPVFAALPAAPAVPAEAYGEAFLRSLFSGLGLALALLGPGLLGLRPWAALFLLPGGLLWASGLWGPGGSLPPGLLQGLSAGLFGLVLLGCFRLIRR